VVGILKGKWELLKSFKIKSINESKTQIEFAQVLKELKTFVNCGDDLDARSILTIPASFDTIQSNATNIDVGRFQTSDIASRTIAASLAYNMKKIVNEKGKWLVYDLGGGTFDVVLIEIKDGEMKFRS
jgi:molecular chaperone DnaK